ILRADLNLQRVYRSSYASAPIWLYVGYYSTGRGGRPEHTPGVCYPSAGWKIVEKRRWIGGVRGNQRANEYVVAKDGERQLVHFWYQSSRSAGLLGIWSVSLDRLHTRLSTGRGDGALIRLSTAIEGDDLLAARQRLSAFADELAPELAARWPTERPKR
ncbi:MAG: exosortase C-terminal domain/associated protein EpsI, partial [Myxococcota bacterium]